RSGHKSDKFCTLTTVRYAKSGVLTPLNFSRFHVALLSREARKSYFFKHELGKDTALVFLTI
ncbi:hypothetical protein ACRJX6_005632, partial [Klebsiella pneumoniae]